MPAQVRDRADLIDVSVCVPVYRRHSEPNVGSLASQLPAAAGALRAELIVVLNGIREQDVPLPLSGATLIRHERNRGVPIAWNVAARAAEGRTLVFVNDDVDMGPESLALLHNALCESDVGVAGPVGTRWDIATPCHQAWVDTRALAAGATAECEVVSGFFFATPACTWREVGGFDEAYSPCGFEEVDYCTAVRLELGLKCVAVAGVTHAHEFGISSARPWRRVKWDGHSERLGRIAERNRNHFRTKWTARATRLGETPIGESS